MRDLRDPQAIGERLLVLRERIPKSVPMSMFADRLPTYDIPDFDANPSCIDKYGRPDELEPRWEEIKVR